MPRSKKVRRFLFILLGFCAIQSLVMSSLVTAAQRQPSARPSVVGVVRDALGRPLADAALTLQSQYKRIIARARTDQAGHFQFKHVAPGTYLVAANKRGFQTAVSIVTVKSQGAANLDIALESETALSLRVVTTVINPQPNALSATGNSQYTLNQHEIAALPQGENTPINEVLLQMPGVVQDDEAQIHVEGEHEDLQWRVNGVMMPMDSFSGFGQIFNSFFVKRVSLLTGVLPVTYGYRDAGVLDLVTKDGCSNPGGNVGFYGGQRETIQPSFEYGACEGPLNYYLTGTYLHDNLAFSSATPGPTPYHNITNQGQGFGTINYQINPLTKLSLICGGFGQRQPVPLRARASASLRPSRDKSRHLSFNRHQRNSEPGLLLRNTRAEWGSRSRDRLPGCFHQCLQHHSVQCGSDWRFDLSRCRLGLLP